MSVFDPILAMERLHLFDCLRQGTDDPALREALKRHVSSLTDQQKGQLFTKCADRIPPREDVFGCDGVEDILLFRSWAEKTFGLHIQIRDVPPRSLSGPLYSLSCGATIS